jgi:hypothetical protein
MILNERQARRLQRGYHAAHVIRLTEVATMHDRDPFRAPTREPKPGTFHRPAHGFGMKRVAEAAELRLNGPMTGEQKLGEGLAELPLRAPRTKEKS